MARAAFLLALAFAGAALTAAGSACAQEIGTRIAPQAPAAEIPDRGLSAADRTRVTIIDFSSCVLKRDRKRAMAALAIFPSEAAAGALSGLASDECLAAGEMHFNTLLFRGGLYIALYRERFGRGVPVLPPGPANFSAGAPQPLDTESAQAIALRDFGECVVRANPELAHRIVTVWIGSAEETRLYAALGPLLGPCLYEGQEVKFSKIFLSGLLAEILYRDATEGSATPPAGNN